MKIVLPMGYGALRSPLNIRNKLSYTKRKLALKLRLFIGISLLDYPINIKPDFEENTISSSSNISKASDIIIT